MRGLARDQPLRTEDRQARRTGARTVCLPSRRSTLQLLTAAMKFDCRGELSFLNRLSVLSAVSSYRGSRRVVPGESLILST